METDKLKDLWKVIKSAERNCDSYENKTEFCTENCIDTCGISNPHCMSLEKNKKEYIYK